MKDDSRPVKRGDVIVYSQIEGGERIGIVLDGKDLDDEELTIYWSTVGEIGVGSMTRPERATIL